MTITYPLTFPTVVNPSNFTMRPRAVVAVGTSIFTNEQQVDAKTGQWWEADVTLPIMKRGNAEKFITFFLKLNGKEGTFLMGDPSGQTPQGAASTTPGTPKVNGNGQTGNTLILKGLPSDTTDYLKAGDYIQLGSGSNVHLHRVLNDVNSSDEDILTEAESNIQTESSQNLLTEQGGGATVDLWPSLRESPSDGDDVTVSDTKGLFRLSKSIGYSINTALIYEINFSAIEAI